MDRGRGLAWMGERHRERPIGRNFHGARGLAAGAERSRGPCALRLGIQIDRSVERNRTGALGRGGGWERPGRRARLVDFWLAGDGIRLGRDGHWVRLCGPELAQPLAKRLVFSFEGSDSLLQLFVPPSEIIEVLKYLGRSSRPDDSASTRFRRSRTSPWPRYRTCGCLVRPEAIAISWEPASIKNCCVENPYETTCICVGGGGAAVRRGSGVRRGTAAADRGRRHLCAARDAEPFRRL